jgi:hypothetical protein
MINTKLRSLLLALFLVIVASVNLVSAQTTPPATASNDDPVAALPASDMVVFADVRRILTDAIPRLFAKDPATLAKMMGLLNEVRTKTGINILAIDRVAMGVRILGGVGPNFKKESVGVAIIAHGDFDANALIAFAKRETKGNIAEQAYGGKTIYSEPPPAPPRKRSERETPAFSVLDANTLLIGDLAQVRATIDASGGAGRVEPTLVQHATQNSNALFGWAINFSPALAETATAGTLPDETARAGIKFFMSIIKQVFASIGSTQTSFNAVVGIRLCDAEQAQSLSELMTAARKQFGSMAGDPHLRGLLDNIQITSQGSVLQVKAEFKDEILQNVINSAMTKPKVSEVAPAPQATPAPAKSKPPAKRRSSGRRRRG